MRVYRSACDAIPPPDARAAAQCRTWLDAKTKPRGSLGRLKELVCQIAALRGEARPAMPSKAVLVMAADHGVTQEGFTSAGVVDTGR